MTQQNNGHVDDVIATELLWTRPAREPEYRLENAALGALAKALAESPGSVVRRLVDLALELTGAQSAGLSLEGVQDGKKVFRWVATAGEFERYTNGTMPRDFSPCGLVVDRNEAVLMIEPARHYRYVAELHLPIHEVLLAPFHLSGSPIGTLWIVSHTPQCQFDAEGLRIVQSLCGFAATAVTTVGLVDKLEDDNARKQRLLQAHAQQIEVLERWFDQAPGFVALLRGPTFVFEMANQAYYDLVGRRDLIGRPLSDALPETRTQGIEALLAEALNSGQPVYGHEVLMSFNKVSGEAPVEAYVDFVCQPVFDAEGMVLGVFVQGHDVTERRLVMDRLRETNLYKDQVLAVVAHEMRNPLAPIQMSVHLLKQTIGEGMPARRSLDIIERQAAMLKALLDDLLDAASIRAGKVVLQRRRIPLQDLVNGAVEAAQPQISRHGHQLHLSLPGEPLIVDVDVGRMTQVITNLLTNAAKYTRQPGLIDLSVEPTQDRVMIKVTDSGEGISKEMLPHIFDMFMQVSETSRRIDGGLGIGLALVRQLVELHGGTVTAASGGPGQGSQFTVCLLR